MGTLYMTPEDFWTHAAPPALLFGDAKSGTQGIDQGSITAPSRIAGTGSGVVTAKGIPRGAWTVRVQCVVGGEVNDAATVNPNATQLPSFRLSRDAGATYSEPVTVSTRRNQAVIEWARFGIEFLFGNGAAPSYVAADTWECLTQPSADIVAGIPVVCASMDKHLVGSFDLPLTSFPADFAAMAADLLRWRLLKKIGIADRQDLLVYRPVETWEWLRSAQKGEFVKPGTSLGIVEQSPGTSFPLFVPPLPDPLWPPI